MATYHRGHAKRLQTWFEICRFENLRCERMNEVSSALSNKLCL